MFAHKDLAAELRQKVSQLTSNSQFWIGLAGGPGSGKSTLAQALKARLGKLLTIIPLDGYHYYRRELDAMEDPVEAHARRGAPFTFNSSRFVNDLIRARGSGEGVFPSFDHALGDPVEASIQLHKGSQIVLVEGNYVLLDTEPWCQLRDSVFDETWFLDVPVAECNRRVCKRHVETGLTETQAKLRVATNDSINAELITNISRRNADRIIRL
ncbi:MAG: uridine kinase [Desulfobacterales bacterium]|nr:uridine kinase [Deltaproteobacteria bacterium]NNF45816.1 uridine kinase [Desulfofustis sp.]NNK96892.1 uridine kinase [Desulfobacterales bacterium]